MVFKENGAKQRKDVSLSKEVAIALVQKIKAGENLWTSEGAKGTIEITMEDGREALLPRTTLNHWIARSNVVPELGIPLRTMLDKARAEYRASVRERRQNDMIEEAERKMQRTLRIRTNLPVVGMFGIIKNEKGEIVRRENHNLLRVQMDTAKYVTERLDSKHYGRVERGEHKHLVFSLADLRRAKEGSGQEENEPFHIQ